MPRGDHRRSHMARCRGGRHQCHGSPGGIVRFHLVDLMIWGIARDAAVRDELLSSTTDGGPEWRGQEVVLVGQEPGGTTRFERPGPAAGCGLKGPRLIDFQIPGDDQDRPAVPVRVSHRWKVRLWCPATPAAAHGQSLRSASTRRSRWPGTCSPRRTLLWCHGSRAHPVTRSGPAIRDPRLPLNTSRRRSERNTTGSVIQAVISRPCTASAQITKTSSAMISRLQIG